jgi:hypothetical protein
MKNEYQIIFDRSGSIKRIYHRHGFPEDIIRAIIEDTKFLDPDATIKERLYCIKNNIRSSPICPTCKNKVKFKHGRYKLYCSPRCSALATSKKSKVTKKLRYGSENYNNRTKAEATTEKKYGVKNYFKRTDLISNHIRRKYGVDNISYNREVVERRAKKISKTHRSKVSHETILWNKELLEHEYIKNGKSISRIAREYEVSDSWLGSKLKNYFGIEKIERTNGFEVEVFEFIADNYSGKILRNARNIIPPKELDIYLPDLNLAIECNGVYYHTTKFRSKFMHMNKTELCENKNIQLIHIFDHDWRSKEHIIKSMILNKLGKTKPIYARNLTVRDDLDFLKIQNFLRENHLYGSLGYRFAYALVDDSEEIYAVMTFSKSRWNKDADFELTRFSTKCGYRVIAGASRLFKTFIRRQPSTVVSYADRTYSDGNLYKKLGFKLLGKTQPNYKYLVGGKLISRYQYQKKKLTFKLQNYDPLLSEEENMKKNGYYRLYDSGNLVFLYSEK